MPVTCSRCLASVPGFEGTAVTLCVDCLPTVDEGRQQQPAHDWECAPWQPPYGIAWTCRTCGTSERVSLVVLSDPERVASMAVALRSACSGRYQRVLPLPPPAPPTPRRRR